MNATGFLPSQTFSKHIPCMMLGMPILRRWQEASPGRRDLCPSNCRAREWSCWRNEGCISPKSPCPWRDPCCKEIRKLIERASPKPGSVVDSWLLLWHHLILTWLRYCTSKGGGCRQHTHDWSRSTKGQGTAERNWGVCLWKKEWLSLCWSIN